MQGKPSSPATLGDSEVVALSNSIPPVWIKLLGISTDQNEASLEEDFCIREVGGGRVAWVMESFAEVMRDGEDVIPLAKEQDTGVGGEGIIDGHDTDGAIERGRKRLILSSLMG